MPDPLPRPEAYERSYSQLAGNGDRGGRGALPVEEQVLARPGDPDADPAVLVLLEDELVREYGADTARAFVLGAAQALWLWNLVRSARHGPPAGPDPWDLADTPHSTREWAHHDPDRGRRTAHDHGDRDGPAADRDR